MHALPPQVRALREIYHPLFGDLDPPSQGEVLHSMVFLLGHRLDRLLDSLRWLLARLLLQTLLFGLRTVSKLHKQPLQ